MKDGNLMIVQGGGPTAVFNSTLASIVQEARSQRSFGKIFGARSGVKGLVQQQILDLTDLSPSMLQLLRNTPGAALGSSRFRPSDAEMETLVQNLRRMDVRKLIFMGGNGTLKGAQIVSAACRNAGLDVRVVGVPKTVDNDLAVTDRSPGFASAARYVAQSTRDLGMDVRALPQPVTILETLGRSVGWLAAASALARENDDDAPHLVYVPEMPFSEESFLSDVDRVVTRQGWAVVVVSEGLQREGGAPVYQMSGASQSDPLQRPMIGGVAQYLAGVVGEGLRIRCRSEKPGLLGRSSMLHVSEQDRKDADLVGRAGVRALAAGETDKMVALRPLSLPGEDGYELVTLTAAAGLERPLPQRWVCSGPASTSKELTAYLSPLVGPLQSYARPLSMIHSQEESITHA